MIRLWIGNLSWKVTDADLEEFFRLLDLTVENVRVITEMSTGRSRGFAFADIHCDPENAAMLVESLHGQMLDGRDLVVKLAEDRGQPKRERSRERRR